MDATNERQRCGFHGPAIAGLARRYCAWIRVAGRDDSNWLKSIATLLPPLHAAMASVRVSETPAPLLCGVDLDHRFELYSRLRVLLADRDGYWLEFDRAGDGAAGMTGSLADDLTDIYYELQAGLGRYEQSPEFGLAVWQRGFHWHWGRHLVDAERHLALLAAQGRLDF